jgi:hypothetical protein
LGESISFYYDSSFGISLPSGEIKVSINKSGIIGLFWVLYGGMELDSLPTFLNRKELADQFLSLCEMAFFLPRKVVDLFVEFATQELFRPEVMTCEILAKNFPRLYKIGCHEEIAKNVDLKGVLAIVCSNDAFGFEARHMKWFLDRICGQEKQLKMDIDEGEGESRGFLLST